MLLVPLSLPSAFEKRICFEEVGKSSLCGERVAEEVKQLVSLRMLMTEKNFKKKLAKKLVE